MKSIRQNPSNASRASFALFALAALATVGCRRESEPCVPAALVDTAGEAGEAARIRLQWLSIQGKLDSAQATPEGMHDLRSLQGRFDSAVARYTDSLRLDGGIVTSRSGCIDWRATWDEGRIDRAALATAWLRRFLPDAGGVVEWNPLDSSTGALTLWFTRPGQDGGTLDSVGLRLVGERVERAVD